MKLHYILAILAFICCSASAYAAVQEYSIKAGESRYIDVPVAGALTASAVSVSGNGISARIHAKYAGKVRLRLTANNNADAGLRVINLRLAMGTNKSNLYVYGIHAARILPSGPETAGKLQQVDISLAAGAGRLIAQTARGEQCFGADSQRGPVSVGNYPVKRSGNTATIFVTSNNNSGNGRCHIRLVESSILKKATSYRDIMLEFGRDSRVPQAMGTAPRITTADNAVAVTANRSGNSPRLTWNAVRDANKYKVYYTTHNNANRTNRNVSRRGWRAAELASGGVLRNLQLGSYDYCVSAAHDPQNSYLQEVESDCSAVRTFTVRQRN